VRDLQEESKDVKRQSTGAAHLGFLQGPVYYQDPKYISARKPKMPVSPGHGGWNAVEGEDMKRN
jgi:hypothetical protein